MPREDPKMIGSTAKIQGAAIVRKPPIKAIIKRLNIGFLLRITLWKFTRFRGIIEENKLLDKVKLALDVAASSFYNKGQYEFDGKNHSGDEFF